MVHTSIRLPPSMVEQIEALAVFHGCRPVNVVRFVLETGIPAMVAQLPPPPRRF
ncbi:hypothetical protein [Synechococcus sp. FACHB-909]|uniref:hypothetical protein n=1 Tax=Synechococcus sp. FACHB-909 TaxID=2692863 RepID=UPI00168535EE|nr:hypothetical protein [Synechococcus sp. FACHB-909]MBD2718108.1 hypothetical protein [Synechococcus sp. FACHB-909]